MRYARAVRVDLASSPAFKYACSLREMLTARGTVRRRDHADIPPSIDWMDPVT